MRKKWSGQEVPSAANFGAASEAIKSSTTWASEKCPTIRASREAIPRNVGANLLGLQFGNVLAGAIVVETVFNWPGLGRLAYESVLRRDYPTILGVLLFASVVVIVMNQITDLCYRLIDPRIKTA